MSTILAIIPTLEHYSLVVMMVVFALLCLSAYWPSHRADMEARGRITFNDPNEPGQRRKDDV